MRKKYVKCREKFLDFSKEPHAHRFIRYKAFLPLKLDEQLFRIDNKFFIEYAKFEEEIKMISFSDGKEVLDFLEKLKETLKNKSMDESSCRTSQVLIDLLLLGLEPKYKNNFAEMICDFHEKIFADQSSYAKIKGKYRTKQVFIRDKTKKNPFEEFPWNPNMAKYVPPPARLLDRFMDDLAAFGENGENKLLLLALKMQQLLIIHPFENGNGRISRVYVLLEMISNDLFCQNFLFIHQAIIDDEDNCLDALNRISERDDVNKWMEVFLKILKNCLEYNCENVIPDYLFDY